eukprot:5167366-Prymnesium_polylepis.1
MPSWGGMVHASGTFSSCAPQRLDELRETLQLKSWSELSQMIELGHESIARVTENRDSGVLRWERDRTVA